MFRTLAIALGLAAQLAGMSASRAEEPVDTARAIIQEQIAAFLHDDAETAYSFASPEIRGKFPDKTAFFDMVKRGYRPVYRPGNFAFGRSKVVGDQVIQEVLISAPDGKDWTALYQLVKQPDGSYKINAVMMLQSAPGPEI
ncbi:DUF4864 domain-containing protein [Ensifer adhaerens]|uniref:DUF4864 domain-containing protein n=1 Tax=Ensifer adhaerens TaxID=106592 RepID=UPI001CBDD900|nr:DUF4864 domain-containing protein [Ensifer adhaerens]MBZ7921701.1 DUF4864 domain-containing protein [Ensifer adhaerens]UAX94109.1 DUF4864 domain-containing protein [Ensifer adhaerens]UAY01743.1 DUF4864 domain-containing protein [Ensifer adhaerens]UAY09127.1 DUF4864 domain-containing protein [Ensifer adhaerens]